MKLPALSRDEVRKVDQIAVDEYGMPGLVLMENAGRGAAEIIDRIADAGPIVILCGGGNNAGDGYVIARHLQLAGRDVRVVSIADPESVKGDAGVNAAIAKKSGIEIRVVTEANQFDEAIGDARTIVDGLLGTVRGPLRGLFADAVNAANARDARRIALDLPTGLDCDTGEVSDPTFRADHTISFVAPKLGFERDLASAYVGEVFVVGIGAPKKLLDQFLQGQS